MSWYWWVRNPPPPDALIVVEMVDGSRRTLFGREIRSRINCLWRYTGIAKLGVQMMPLMQGWLSRKDGAMMNMRIIDDNGQFDARKARQLLFEFTRDNSVVNHAHSLATHLGLSSEEAALLMAVALLEAHEGLLAHLMEEVRIKVPTFRMQATKDGPFQTKQGS